MRRRTLLAGAGGALIASRIGTASPQSASSIPLGFCAPLSGTNAPVGQPLLLGAQIACDQINAKGGVNGRKIELIVLDDQGDPTRAATNIRELSSRGISLFLGPATTATGMAVIGLVQSVNGVYFGLTVNDERLTHELFNRHYFQTVENSYTRGNVFAEVMANRYPEITSWTGAIWDAGVGHDYWNDVAKALHKYYLKIAKRDVTIIEPVFCKTGTTDFKVQISQLLQAPAQGLVTIMGGSDGITFYKQMVPFGLAKKFSVFLDGAIDINLAKALGRNIPPNVWSGSHWYYDAAQSNTLSQELAREVIKRTGEVPHGFVGVGHLSVTMCTAAIEQTGSVDTDTVISALERMKTTTVKGSTYFRKEDHQIIANSYLFNLKPKDGPPGFETNETIVVPIEDAVNPPEPGRKWSQ